MINYETEVIINRPVEQVYKLVTDVARFDDWTEMTGTHLVSGSKMQVGGQMETSIKMGPMKQTMVFELTGLEENRRMAFKTVSKGAMEWDGEYTFEPQGPSSTRVVNSGQIRLNGLLKLSEPLIAGEIRSGEAKELVKLKELVEGAS